MSRKPWLLAMIACLVWLVVCHTFVEAASLPESPDVPSVLEDEVKSYRGHRIYRIKPKYQNELDWLKILYKRGHPDIEFWRAPTLVERHVDIRVSPENDDVFSRQLRGSSINYEVMVDDLQRLIEDGGIGSNVSEPETDPSTFNVSAYHRYNEILDWVDYMASQCGSICKTFVIGRSYEGRPLKVIRIGVASDERPAIWVDAGIHAREWIAPATAIYLINKLVKHRSRDALIEYLLNKYTWYIMPVANPDGYEFTWTNDRLWRKTRSRNPGSQCRGADPNRNWDFHWAGMGTSNNPCSENYHGPWPFSEPETRAMASFILSIRDQLMVYLSLHSYGQYWLTPWGFTYDLPNDYNEMLSLGNLATAAMKEKAGTKYEVGQSSRLLYLAAGGSDDWAKGVAGVKYSYTVELRDTGRHGFVLPASYINSTGAEMLHALKSLTLEILRKKLRQY